VGRYLIRRTMFMVLVLFIVSLLTFVIFVKLPSTDPVIRAVGRHPSPELVAQVRAKFGLDQPLYVQYWKFAKGLIPIPGFWLNEDVYYSYGNRVAVKEEISQRLPITATLTAGAAVTWLIIGIPIGIVSAIRPGSFFDRAGTLFALFGVSVPIFWLGIVMIYIFHFTLGIAPATGLPRDKTLFEAVLSGHFVLPWLTLAITSAAFYSRLTRTNLMEAMGEDYIRTARAKGMRERRVISKHGFRSALTPLVTIFGLDVAFTLSGAVITENVFGLPGLGAYALAGVYTADFPVVMGVTVLGAVFIVVANLVVDVIYAALDPRVRYT
jgi:peptide/nickel transport system permease protein